MDISVVGMVGLYIKDDPDFKEPPNSVGQIDNLYVLPEYRGGGLGEELLNTALSHSKTTGLRAVEMLIDDVEDGARKLCERQDWTLESIESKSVFGIFKLELYRYRKASCQI